MLLSLNNQFIRVPVGITQEPQERLTLGTDIFHSHDTAAVTSLTI